MFLFRLIRQAAIGTALMLLSGAAVAAPELRLSREQEARLAELLPRTAAKLKNREPVRVVSVGDSISTFYQSPGFPRYDSAMSWQGRLLNRLGGYYDFHGVVDVDAHREVENSQKDATREWSRYAAELSEWKQTRKGSAPTAPDPLRFQADLVAPITMSVPELARRGVPATLQSAHSAAIQIHNLARDGSQAAEVLEGLSPEAFPQPPAPPTDLVTICYGVNDSAGGLPLESFRNFLTLAVRLCQANGADVILAAPPVSFAEGLPRESLGRTRPYAQVAREVAEAGKVAFVDLGAALVRAPSDLEALTAADAFDAALVPLKKAFAYSSTVIDTLHPNAAATLHAGESAARQILNGPPPGTVQVTGALNLTGPAEATAQLRLVNTTDTPRTVVVSPLSFTGWALAPGTPDTLFNLPPGKARRLNLPLVAIGTGASPAAGVVRGSLLLSDDDVQRLADVMMPVTPLSVVWPEGRFDAASGDVLLPAALSNSGFAPVKGTARILWMGKTEEVPFSIEPGRSFPLPMRLALPDTASLDRFLEFVTVETVLPDRTLQFTHTVEGVRYIGLEQRMPLVQAAHWQPGTPAPEPDAWVTPFADAGGIYFVVEFPASSSPTGTQEHGWGGMEVQLDGRKASENGTLGFVDRISTSLPWEDGPVAIRKVRPAAFGHTYFLEYHPDGFRVIATTKADGSRRLEFNIARVNLAQHEWSLDGSGQNTLGFNLRISRSDPVTGALDPATTRSISSSGFGGTDARSLAVLELSRTPSKRWSLRVF